MYGATQYPDVRTVDVHSRRLREKIEANPSELRCTHQMGCGLIFPGITCEVQKSGKFFKSLRFRIMIILIILGIVPSVIVTEMVIANYEDRAIANRVQSMENICDIMCDLLIKENYLNDSSSQTVNSKLELLSNIYGKNSHCGQGLQNYQGYLRCK